MMTFLENNLVVRLSKFTGNVTAFFMLSHNTNAEKHKKTGAVVGNLSHTTPKKMGTVAGNLSHVENEKKMGSHTIHKRGK